MATVILVRHGRTTANASGTLAGRMPGVGLDDVGEAQVAAVAERLAPLRLAALVSSPLERCARTAEVLAAAQQGPGVVPVHTDPRLTECDYGQWQGRSIKDLTSEDLWRTVQRQPSAAVFPEGESLREMSSRAVAAVRERDAQVEEAHGAHAVWAAVSHGDVIKAVLTDALGAHLDQFQRIVADPASVSIVRYTEGRPFVLGLNTHAGDLTWLSAPPAADDSDQDAVVGGGAGPGLDPVTGAGSSGARS